MCSLLLSVFYCLLLLFSLCVLFCRKIKEMKAKGLIWIVVNLMFTWHRWWTGQKVRWKQLQDGAHSKDVASNVWALPFGTMEWDYERIEEYDTRDENVMCELFVSCRVGSAGRADRARSFMHAWQRRWQSQDKPRDWGDQRKSVGFHAFVKGCECVVN